MGATLARPLASLAPDGPSGSSPCSLSLTLCTPFSSASRSPRSPSLRLAATRSSGRAATVFSWCTYPVVYIIPMLSGSESGKAGLTAGSMVGIQVGYTASDIISKCGVGYLVYRIGLAKSMAEDGKYEAAPAGEVGV